MLYIQLIGILAFCLLVLSYYKKSTASILIYQIVSNFAYAVHYFLLGALSGAYSSIVSIFRNILFMKFKNHKIFITIFIELLYLAIAYIFFENIYSIIPIIGTSIYLISMNFDTRKSLLIGGIFNSISWMTYAIFVSSYAGIVTEAIIVISNVIQLKKVDLHM